MQDRSTCVRWDCINPVYAMSTLEAMKTIEYNVLYALYLRCLYVIRMVEKFVGLQ